MGGVSVGVKVFFDSDKDDVGNVMVEENVRVRVGAGVTVAEIEADGDFVRPDLLVECVSVIFVGLKVGTV